MRLISKITVGLSLIATINTVSAKKVKTSNFHFMKNIKVIQQDKSATYGQVRLDEDVIKYSKDEDLRIVYQDKAVPFIRRKVKSRQVISNVGSIRVIFSKVKKGRSIYVIKLPYIAAGLSYRNLFIVSKRNFESNVKVESSDNANNFTYVSNYTVYRYKGRKQSTIPLIGRASYIRLTFQGIHELSFAKVQAVAKSQYKDHIQEIKASELSISENGDTSSTIFYINNENRSRVEKVVLFFKDKKFSRDIRIEKFDTKRKRYQEEIFSQISKANESESKQTIKFTYALTSKFKIVIQNSDDAPLNLEKLQLISPSEELVFKIPSDFKTSGLNLYYGNDYARSLKFDIKTTFKSDLPLAKFTLDKHQKNSNFAYSLIEPPLSIWAIRGLFVILLAAILYPAYKLRFKSQLN